ncbi:MAG: cyclic nucleotide-binding domain-containing protein [Myxococcota bacterium]
MATTPMRQLLTVLHGCIKGGNPGRALRLLITNMPRTRGDFLLRRYVAELLLGLDRRKEAVSIFELLVRHFTNVGQPLLAIAIARVLNNLDRNNAGSQLDHIASIYAQGSPFIDTDLSLQDPLEHTQLVSGASLDLSGTEPDLSLDELIAQAFELATRKDDLATSADAVPPIPLLSLLESNALRNVLDHIELRTLAPDTVISTPGEPFEEVLWLLMGELKVTSEDRSSRAHPGALVGHQSHLSAAPAVARFATSTVGTTEVLALSHGALQALRRDTGFMRASARFDIACRTEQVLTTCAMFDPVPLDERRELLQFMEPLRLADDTILIEQDEPSPGLFVVVDGHVDINKQSAGEALGMTIKTIGSGDVAGEISVVTDGTAVATVVTDGTARVLFIDRDNFQQLTTRYPMVLERLRESAASRLLSDV